MNVFRLSFALMVRALRAKEQPRLGVSEMLVLILHSIAGCT